MVKAPFGLPPSGAPSPAVPLWSQRHPFFAPLQEGTVSGSLSPFQPLPQAVSWAEYTQDGLGNFFFSFLFRISPPPSSLINF